MFPIDSSALATLRAALSPSASVNLPGDPSYSIKRWALNAEKPAAAVACPVTPEDVVQILAFVQGKAPYEAQQRIPVVVKVGCNAASFSRCLADFFAYREEGILPRVHLAQMEGWSLISSRI
jgi:hypothetical protein